MFTGIVEELGTLQRREDMSGAARLTVRANVVVEDTRPGDSVSVNGVCLTVVDVDAEGFSADVIQETLNHSSLGKLTAGEPVNLERAVTAHTRLGGHLVQGHVDATATVISRNPDEHWDVVHCSLPEQLARYVVHKGSITVDGVSLTVSAIGSDWFEVSLIPTTLARTTLGSRQPGDLLNLEVDVIAKYVEKLMAGAAR
jgi:riboflavin synthase